MMLKIEKENGVVKFHNGSEHTLVIYLKPIKPKRKLIKIIVMNPESFTIFDTNSKYMREDIDLTTLYFSLEKE